MEIFQQTPLGQFLAQLPAEQQQELVQGFVGDCVLSTMNVSTREELEVGAVTGGDALEAGAVAGGTRWRQTRGQPWPLLRRLWVHKPLGLSGPSGPALPLSRTC